MIEINGQNITIDQLVRVADGEEVRLAASAQEVMKKSKKYIADRIQKGEVIYGVNTGFGAFSSVSISLGEIEQLQKNLIRSHAVGVGEPFSRRETRAILCLRANALSRGHSGIRVEVVEKILEFLNKNVLPYIPSQGSVGASGDLAPLSHLALALMGEGEVWDDSPSASGPISAKEKILKLKIEPLTLQAKEGLALINGCQVMTAVGLLAAHDAKKILLTQDIVGALSLEALRGSRSAFDPLITESRPHVGEKQTAANLRAILTPTSELADSHKDCDRVQDPYSLRCMPAVHGATKDALKNAIRVLEVEANSSTDNPLVFADDGKILSCGNFHGEPVAFQMDFLAIAMAAAASISECRISKLINPNFSRLPTFLTAKGGLNSGMMIVQVAAASLVSENKIYTHPASVDSIPTNVDKEDHVSMGTIAARKLCKVIENFKNILAMEILCANQAMSFLSPLKSSPALEAVLKTVRKEVPPFEEDRYFAPEIRSLYKMINDGTILKAVTEKNIHLAIGD
jgi:histidine ammonia-lyase